MIECMALACRTKLISSLTLKRSMIGCVEHNAGSVHSTFLEQFGNTSMYSAWCYRHFFCILVILDAVS